MTRLPIIAAFFSVMLPLSAHAQAQTDSMVPTIPESQIEGKKLSSTYEFLSAATSIDDFQLKLGELAKTQASDLDVKALAMQLQADHQARLKALTDAGKTEKVEIAKASADGEQQGMLGKIGAQKGADFDRSFVETQIYIHQREIAYYRGYSEEANGLGAFAKETLPTVVGRYAEVLKLAPKYKLELAPQTESQQ